MADDEATRITHNARKALRLAEKEAIRLGHEYVGSVHVLFGLSKEGKGVAGHVLDGIGLTPELLHEAIKNAWPYHTSKKPSKPLPISPKTKFSITKASEVYKGLSRCISTEHVLLGILLQEDDAVDLLTALGKDVDQIRQRVFEFIGYKEPHGTETNE